MMMRSAAAVLFTVVAAFGLTGSPAIAASSAATSEASTASTDARVRAFSFRYYAEPAKLTLVGERVTAQCIDYPEYFWGEETEWYTVITGWVECPGPQ